MNDNVIVNLIIGASVSGIAGLIFFFAKSYFTRMREDRSDVKSTLNEHMQKLDTLVQSSVALTSKMDNMEREFATFRDSTEAIRSDYKGLNEEFIRMKVEQQAMWKILDALPGRVNRAP